MKCKFKFLLIGIALSFFIGNILPNPLYTTEVEERLFSTWTKTVDLNKTFLDSEENILLNTLPSNANLALTQRLFSKNNRYNPSSSFRHGLLFIKGKEHKDFYFPTYTLDTKRFSSRLNEARRQLISFGRLII